jgi:hypothetical protein
MTCVSAVSGAEAAAGAEAVFRAVFGALGAAPDDFPQPGQNLLPAGISFQQFGQNI